jgi:transposase
MLTQEQRVEIKVMARRGQSIRQIARELGVSRNTVRRQLRGGASGYGPRAVRATKLEPYWPYLRERTGHALPRRIPAVVLLREIRERGYMGGLTQLKVWLAAQQAPQTEPAVRFETAPGEQMQADFTWVRKGREPLVAFVATLGWSRASFVRFDRREDYATLAAGLRAAFDYFGGVPEHVLFDNPKTVVLERDVYGEGRHRWNAQLLELAEQCGFAPRLCRPYRARTKGKVERFNRYLKESFVTPLAASLKAAGLTLTVEIANARVRRWLDEVANRRVHATTGEVPAVRLAQERTHMLAAPALRAPAPVAQHVAVPLESLQHPLAVYDALLEVAA